MCTYLGMFSLVPVANFCWEKNLFSKGHEHLAVSWLFLNTQNVVVIVLSPIDGSNFIAQECVTCPS